MADKGWAEAIHAVRRARERCEINIHLVLVGNGPIYEDYLASELPEFVHLVGYSHNSVGYYAMSDMGIMLTKFRSESFPLTIVECLFAGKPYLSSDIGEIKNILTDGDEIAGAVVELDHWTVQIEKVANQICSFATDRQRYTKAIGVVPKLLNRFKIDASVDKHIEIFQSDIARSRQ